LSAASPGKARRRATGGRSRPGRGARRLTVAALFDVHGNLPALEAVLAELEAVEPDVVLFGGDLAAGPMPRETVALARQLETARFVRGNGDREMAEGDDAGQMSGWAAGRLDDDEREFLRTLPLTVELDRVLYCHATPHADDPFVTVLTPDDLAREIVGEAEYPTMVVGHTHSQFDRRLGELRLVNAGSVGMPYEDAPGAYWALVDQGEPAFRRTEYDLEAAAERVRATGWPPAEQWIAENLLGVPTARDAAAFFESQR
jgi:putative phosphoesterase